ncbi:FAD-dependent oxidoreductase [Psychrobacillus sp. FSL W7-1493]|uniref:FAD-dependent oxidoreductase n=1 Tax=Psychrobacillus sp. FSL W7-1493 TaxID=2921552 RepID=UPI0030F870A1
MTEKILPGNLESYWLANNELPLFPKLNENIEVDVLVVGAGLTGITAAYLLSKSGKSVAVIEGSKILNGTTGFTTAKVTAQHGHVYQQLINTFNEEKAKLYYEAQVDALNFVERTVSDLGIKCDFEKVAAYIYADTEEGVDTVTKEMDAYEKLGIGPATLTEQTELPYQVKKALRLDNQGQFHPVKYAKALVDHSVQNGVHFFEETRAKDVLSDNIVKTVDGHKIKAKKILVCSHYPFNDENGLYFTRLEPHRSYVIAAPAEKNSLKGMYINVEQPTRSIRSALGSDGKRYILLGGEGHVTGRQEGDTTAKYETLAAYGREKFNFQSYNYRWSAQDLETLDKVPYIGVMTSDKPDVLVATGYRKWGMTNSVVAAQIMVDNVLGKENRFAEFFAPTRSKMKKEDITKFTKANASVAKEFVKGKTEKVDLQLEDLKVGTGDIVKVEGKKVGAYKDQDGKVYLVKPVCTHLGCDVAFNNAESSWDCPCHGSRFNYKGEVLEGPAFEPLKRLN